MALLNKWHLRTVAENAAKPCWIDYKTTTMVLITPDNKDFFYICRGHLKDRTFCTPSVQVGSPDDAAKKREDEINEEIEAIKKEYSDKQAKKKDSSKEGGANKKNKKVNGNDDDEKEKDEKIKAAKEDSKKDSNGEDDLPRIYSLHRYGIRALMTAIEKSLRFQNLSPLLTKFRNFFQMRIDRIRNAETARRNRERFKDPNLFPSAPTGGL